MISTTPTKINATDISKAKDESRPALLRSFNDDLFLVSRGGTPHVVDSLPKHFKQSYSVQMTFLHSRGILVKSDIDVNVPHPSVGHYVQIAFPISGYLKPSGR